MSLPRLDPLNQALLDKLNATPSPPLQDLTPQQFRDLLDRLQEHTPIPGVDVKDFEVEFDKHTVKTVVFRPEKLKRNELDAIFYIHGGAWIGGKYVQRPQDRSDARHVDGGSLPVVRSLMTAFVETLRFGQVRRSCFPITRSHRKGNSLLSRKNVSR
jgi:hypothetical protein